MITTITNRVNKQRVTFVPSSPPPFVSQRRKRRVAHVFWKHVKTSNKGAPIGPLCDGNGALTFRGDSPCARGFLRVRNKTKIGEICITIVPVVA